MSTFIGDYTCKFDAKGRVVLPSAFKKRLKPEARDSFVVRKDIFEKCLVLYPLDEWEKQEDLLRKRINPYNREHQRFMDAFYRGTAELSLDASNRLLIPKRLLDLCGIGKDVVLAAQVDKIKIWDTALYDGKQETEEDFAALAEKILGGPLKEDN